MTHMVQFLHPPVPAIIVVRSLKNEVLYFLHFYWTVFTIY